MRMCVCVCARACMSVCMCVCVCVCVCMIECCARTHTPPAVNEFVFCRRTPSLPLALAHSPSPPPLRASLSLPSPSPSASLTPYSPPLTLQARTSCVWKARSQRRSGGAVANARRRSTGRRRPMALEIGSLGVPKAPLATSGDCMLVSPMLEG